MSEEIKTGLNEGMPTDSVQVKTRWKDPKHQEYHDDLLNAIQGGIETVRLNYNNAKKALENSEDPEGVKNEAVEVLNKSFAHAMNQIIAQIPTMVIGYFNRQGAFLADARDTARLNWLEHKILKGEVAIGWDEELEAPCFDITTQDVDGESFKDFREMIDEYMLREKDS